VQHVTEPPDAQRNFLVVDQKTEDLSIEQAFERFTQERKDIAIVLINQHVCHLACPMLKRLKAWCSWSMLTYLTRSPNGYGIKSIHTLQLFLLSSKFHQKTIHTIQRRTVYYDVWGGYLANRTIELFRAFLQIPELALFHLISKSIYTKVIVFLYQFCYTTFHYHGRHQEVQVEHGRPFSIRKKKFINTSVAIWSWEYYSSWSVKWFILSRAQPYWRLPNPSLQSTTRCPHSHFRPRVYTFCNQV